MAHSRRFRDLQARIRELRKHMLPVKFDPTGIYAERVIDRTRGFTALVHAEFEVFVEERSKEVVLAAINEWTYNRRLSRVLFSFICCYQSGWKPLDFGRISEQIDLAKNRKNPQVEIGAVVTLASNQYSSLLGKNHGIKQENLRNILMPAGVDLSDLDAVWLTDVNDFGEHRGRIVHLSKSSYVPDPRGIYSRVQRLLYGFGEIDLLLEERLSNL